MKATQKKGFAAEKIRNKTPKCINKIYYYERQAIT